MTIHFNYLTAFADQSEDVEEITEEFVIPEDVSALTDDELTALHEQAVGHFQTLYTDSRMSDDDVEALAQLTDGIEALTAEIRVRDEQRAERAERAAELAARVGVTVEAEDTDEDDEEADNEEDDGDEDEADEDGEDEQAEEEGEAVVASTRPARREVRVAVSRRNSRFVASEEPRSMRDVVYTPEAFAGYGAGQGIDWDDIGRILDDRLRSYNDAVYASAAAAGKSLRHQMSLAAFRKPLDPELTINSNDPAHINEVMKRAVDESRLQGGSLVAAGGWCAPSETLYDLVELETRTGIFDLPEVGIARGGISRTLGPDFATLFADIAGSAFSYTEEQDIVGDYDGSGGGTKPCYRIECPEFEEFRLQADGLCLQAGLLQARGYPEMIARVTRGALIAHEHFMAGKRIQAVVDGSTKVTMPGGGGAVAPLLSAIELQITHTRYLHRLSDTATVEAVFPYWVRGVIRADLSRRQGVALLSVTDAQIVQWFRDRGANAQFVYNWQDLAGTADTVTNWPAEVQFIMYPAGTWIKGTSPIITMDALYDSTLLGTNDYTALFTEEGWVVVKMSHDSRVITVPLCVDGAASAGVAFECDGTVTPAAVETP